MLCYGSRKQDLKGQSYLNKVNSKYGDNINFTGHGLDGSIIDYLARSNHDIKTIAFSRGSGALQTFRKRPKKFIDVSNRNDPILYFERNCERKRKFHQ